MSTASNSGHRRRLRSPAGVAALAEVEAVRIVLEELDRAAVLRWVGVCLDLLTAHRDELDRLNVFPVPDADTGTNLVVTLSSAGSQAQHGGSPAAVLDQLARAAMLGARGNSGLVLSQLVRGLAEAAAPAAGGGPLAATWLRDGLRRAAELATAAFATPVDGTALTVLDAAAAAADDAGSDKLAVVADAAVAGAAAALADTPRRLAVLARAGVVDAGGRGMLLVLDALAAVVTGRPPSPAPTPRVARPADLLRAARNTDCVGAVRYDYEVMYLLDASSEARVATLRAELATLGDSVAVVGDGHTWKVHVHCTDVGAAIEAGIEAGRPYRITVIRFADQPAAPPPPAGGAVASRAVVAVAPGAGMAELFGAEGVSVVVPPAGPDQVLAAITATGAAHVVVLPNAADGITDAARAANHAREAGHDVVVVPTVSPVQGLAALAVHDPARRAGDDVVAMTEAAAATRCGELRVATEEALTWAGRCRPGDVLGVVDGEVVLIGATLAGAACDLVRLMLSAGGELVTVLLGADAPAPLADTLAELLRRERPEVEFAVYHGGQAGSPLLVGVE